MELLHLVIVAFSIIIVGVPLCMWLVSRHYDKAFEKALNASEYEGSDRYMNMENLR